MLSTTQRLKITEFFRQITMNKTKETSLEKPVYNVYSIKTSDMIGLESFDHEESRNAKSMAINWINDVLEATNGFSLMSELNDLQGAFRTESGVTIESKYDFPLMVINALIRPYNLLLAED